MTKFVDFFEESDVVCYEMGGRYELPGFLLSCSLAAEAARMRPRF